ncbi:MAG: hypothetical protein UW68_C0018G0010 [Candidatus Collierbacteria bacterium GW2011_GWB1_44_6]|uniref:Uncharacterized protein n=2 Tax=Candidatus Collieribacteriota TaxID=1752725 RepID=A0A0G1JNC4_9BACT|nr:MAG: hypothetical protein UV68_C0039G0001 [Candidatus Collierbacteria bacterium GW2011_GWC2_43_12]KKT73036.1 MAG: hypothetical protein UW68_C0018G0010 [Candidatus Collierbacteria bacterium GW2011_GWB1_44_6]KKT82839.1 MAG: hypothetical protein UW80_C0029G0002 [Microgenomates group bacterium GW2011_GWC1_44_9]
MALRPWSAEGASPYSSTGPVEGIPQTEESKALLKEVSDPKQRLDPVAAKEARKEYLRRSSTQINQLTAAMDPWNNSSDKPGEAGTDEEDISITEETGNEVQEGFQILRPADEDLVKEMRDREIAKDPTVDLRHMDEEVDHYVSDPGPLTKAVLPPVSLHDISSLPKERRTFIDDGPPYVRKPQPDTITMSSEEILEESKKRKLWQDPLDKESFGEEPGFLKDLEAEEKRKQSKPWRW